MSDTVQIVLIVALTILVVLIIFRRRLSNFQFRGGKNGMEMLLKTRKETKSTTSSQPGTKSSGVSVSRNKLWGKDNLVNVQSGSRNISVDDNQMLGEGQKISVNPESKEK